MADVAQSIEHRVVVPVAAGLIPVVRPTDLYYQIQINLNELNKFDNIVMTVYNLNISRIILCVGPIV